MHVIDLFDWGVRNHADRLAFSGTGGDITYREAGAATNRIARALLAEGSGVGTRFAALSPNCSQIMVAMLGGMRTGATWCNVNVRAGVDVNVDVLRRGGCEVMFVHSSVAETVPAFLAGVPTLRRVVCVDSDRSEYPFLGSWCADQAGDFLDHHVPDEAIAFQGSTGGTTGAPKLTQATNRSLFMSVLAWATCLHFDSPPVNAAVTPVTHAAGLIAFAQFQFGGTTILTEPDVDGLLDLIETRRVTTLFLPPTLIYALLAHPRLDDVDTSCLRYLLAGAAPISPDKLTEAVGRLGPVVGQAYGQIEAGILTWISPTEVAEAIADPTQRHRLLSCGRPVATCTSIETMDDDGRVLPAGQTGELVVRAPTVMAGYLDDAAATAEAQADGWHRTGDIGRRDDDGYVFITDRMRDMIVSGGFNLYPFEIEQVLLAHPAVQDCAVIGVPDPKWGEAVKACVQLKAGAAATESDLIAACKDALGSMRAPKSVDFVELLPRSPVGKVLKRVLREPYWSNQARRVS